MPHTISVDHFTEHVAPKRIGCTTNDIHEVPTIGIEVEHWVVSDIRIAIPALWVSNARTLTRGIDGHEPSQVGLIVPSDQNVALNFGGPLQARETAHRFPHFEYGAFALFWSYHLGCLRHSRRYSNSSLFVLYGS